MAGPDSSYKTHALGLIAPSRLHLGFLDMGGHLGRQFGSLGVSLKSPSLHLEAQLASRRVVHGPQAARAERLLDSLAQQFGFDQAVAVRILRAIPDHAGLGSGTQLALGLGTLVAQLHGRPLAAATLAQALDRGNRSGIGIGAFEGGGFLLDGGRGPQGLPPPILARLAFPAEWRILLLFDPGHQGLHGAAEVEAFRRLPVFPASAAARLCHLTLMQALPALAEGDLDAFGKAITELQETVGDHFAPAQGGRFSSKVVTQALHRLQHMGVHCRGQSSWGPTGFAVAPDAARAAAWAEEVGDLGASGLKIEITEASTEGMRWTPAEASLTGASTHHADLRA